MEKDHIKQERIKKGYSQEQTARLLGVTLRTYQKIENEKNYLPNVLTGLKLAIILDTDPIKLWCIK